MTMKSPTTGLAGVPAFLRCAASVLLASLVLTAQAEEPMMKEHCAKCHNEEKAKGKFKLSLLGDAPSAENLPRWLKTLDQVKAEEMPPEDESKLSPTDREKLVAFIEGKLRDYQAVHPTVAKIAPRRLNNREFENSIRDVLMIEDIGTHQPTANLIGDTLNHGFDTDVGELGLSMYHLEQYLDAVRKIVDATILSGDRPASRRIEVPARNMTGHGKGNRADRGSSIDFQDPKVPISFEDFATAPTTGRYKITIRCTGKDRNLWDTKWTGIYPGDPIRMSVHLGDRVKTFDLPDEKTTEIVLDEWIAAGSPLKLTYPTNGLTLQGNGNFKFQYGIAAHYLKEHQPKLYQEQVQKITANGNGKKAGNPDAWQNWKNMWQAPRPVIYSAVVEGPFYESWPTARQVALLGKNPSVANAAAILKPIAERAWRRPVRTGELDAILALVQSKAKTMNDIEALKEGIVAVLTSPAFLLLNMEDLTPQEHFAAKFDCFLGSTIPDAKLRAASAEGRLDSFEAVRAGVQSRIAAGKAEPFLKAFPTAWLLLKDINFMPPDPEHFAFYHRKKLSESMTAEALAFFRHAVTHNIPVPEFLTANYSFINADLARIYEVKDVPPDSKLRQYTFTDGRRGGLLGMGAFLTITADALSTSPIHRAKYVMENFFGIHPTPPPPNVKVEEPDVRQARTIKEILAKHSSDANCAACHATIDPWGYAFENFDPTGAWRSVYEVILPNPAGDDEAAASKKKKQKNASPTETVAIDASAKFRNGTAYRDIIDFRKQVLSPANRDRFVRCFITKLLTYANGEEPTERDFVEVDRILSKSAANGYRTVDTIAAVIDSPLFRKK
jgi:hypothetical protein